MEGADSRVRAIVRRGHAKSSSIITVGDLTIDIAKKAVSRGDAPIDLTAREYGLLEYLAHRVGEVVSRTDLWEHLWEDHAEISSNVVDVYVGYIRNKIDKPFKIKLLHTRRGQGYILTDTAEDSGLTPVPPSAHAESRGGIGGDR